MTVMLTREHIDSGKRDSPCDCPFAIAIKEQLPGHPSVAVLSWDVWIDGEPKFIVPIVTRRIIHCFDLEGVKPPLGSYDFPEISV